MKIAGRKTAMRFFFILKSVQDFNAVGQVKCSRTSFALEEEQQQERKESRAGEKV
jgi:hypothetical protein